VAESQQSNNDSRDWYYRPVNLSLADRVYGWLAIITARKVLPIWEQFGTGEIGDESYSHDPTTMLKTAEDFMLGLAETSQVKIDLCNRFHFGVIGVEYQTNKQGWYANGAAYRALEAIFQGGEDPSADNFVMEAVGAFSIVDPNEPGLWWEKYWEDYREKYIREAEKEENRSEKVKKFVPITIDTEKQLEFWEWWLTEAIPEAWHLAQYNLDAQNLSL
jgi:hypothetical protein